jgi:FAD-dependent oxidoreductase family protein
VKGHRTTTDVVTEEERVLPVWKKADVLVVGGGVSGIVAAVASARRGARTALIEQSGVLGGMAAVGLPFLAFLSTGGKRLTGGIPEEIVSRMTDLGGCTGHTLSRGEKKYNLGSITIFDPEIFRRVVLELLTESGVEISLHTWFAMPWMDGASVRGAFVETKSGRTAISAGVTVDCSGDGDVAARAGAPMVAGDGAAGQLQSSTVLFDIAGVDMDAFVEAQRAHPDLYRTHHAPRTVEGAHGKELRPPVLITGLEPLMVPMHAKGELGFPQPYLILSETTEEGHYLVNMAKVDGVDATDADSYSGGEVVGRMRVAKVVEFLRGHVPGFEQARVTRTPYQIGIRESRHLVGEHVLTVDEMVARATYPDAIAMGGYYVDIHRREEKVDAAKRVIPETKTFPDGYFIPYGCLLPKEVDHLLVAGRCSSATQAANGSCRVMPCCMAQGQAAGVAAALSTASGVRPRDIDVAAVQDALRRMGGVFESDSAMENLKG